VARNFHGRFGHLKLNLTAAVAAGEIDLCF